MRTFFHTFKDEKIDVEYCATNHSSFTEVWIDKAYVQDSETVVLLSDEQRDKFEAYIAEHHLEWVGYDDD